jgi:hypothetical protein
VGVQEGGYSLSYTPFCTLAVIEGLAGARTSIADGWIGSSEYAHAERAFSDAQAAAIDAARETQASFWKL